jgi:very-short-patch-repair endonuclease
MRFQRRSDPAFRCVLRNNARDLRSNLTPAELKLWVRLKNRQLGGLRFRRQHRISDFIVDFYCAASRLVIELDGPSHVEEAQAEKDDIRDKEFSSRGLRVVRFSNDDVHENIEGVLVEIGRFCSVEL